MEYDPFITFNLPQAINSQILALSSERERERERESRPSDIHRASAGQDPALRIDATPNNYPLNNLWYQNKTHTPVPGSKCLFLTLVAEYRSADDAHRVIAGRRANVAHMRQTRPDSGLGFLVESLTLFSLRSEAVGLITWSSEVVAPMMYMGRVPG